MNKEQEQLAKLMEATERVNEANSEAIDFVYELRELICGFPGSKEHKGIAGMQYLAIWLRLSGMTQDEIGMCFADSLYRAFKTDLDDDLDDLLCTPHYPCESGELN